MFVGSAQKYKSFGNSTIGDQGMGGGGFDFVFGQVLSYFTKMFKFHKFIKVDKGPLFSFQRPILHCTETDPLPAHFMKPKRIL